MAEDTQDQCDALTYTACLENIADASKDPNYFFEHSDIRNREEMDAIFEKYDPEAVIHLAAESHVDRSIDDPSNFIETNVFGTFNLLEAARCHWQACSQPDTFRFHHVSTDEVLVASQSIPQLNSQKICPIVQEALTQPQKQVLTILFVLTRDLWPSGSIDELFKQLRSLSFSRKACASYYFKCARRQTTANLWKW